MRVDHKAKLVSDADRCVMCGLCSPSCPTYLKTRNEAESPRGRVALINAFASGQLAVTARLLAHVESCLLCRACEAICPSGVEVTALIDRARAEVATDRHRSQRQRVFDLVLNNPRWLRLSGRALRWGERSGLRAFARYSGAMKATGLNTVDDRLPEIPAQLRLRRYYPAAGEPRGDVAMFRGCATAVLDMATLLDATHVLNRLGINVHVPPDQVCCGALHHHDGAPEVAESMAKKNVRAFDQQNVDAIVSVASGCTAMLADYETLWHGVAGTPAFASKVTDINRFLIQTSWPAGTVVAPLRKRVAVHLPCSQAFGLSDATSTAELLRKIPDVDLVALPGNKICCGAAGSHMLTHSDMADALLADKLAELKKIAPDILVTSNIGCALHFRHGLKNAGLDVEVLHPVALLRRQMT